MRIGIDARSILNPEKGDAIGVGHYTYQLISNLLKVDKENEYVLFFDWRVREKDVKKFTQDNVKIKFYPFSDYRKYMPVAYNEILGAATLNREKLDILHSTSQFNRIPTSYRGKLLVTVNDLAPYKLPEAFPKLKRTKLKAITNLMMDKATEVIAVSESLKNDIQKLFKISSDKIEIIRGGLDRRFWDDAKIAREKVLCKYGIKDKYILFLGTLEPSKNITRLLQAFKIFQDNLKNNKIKSNFKLILAGKRGWLSKEYKQIVRDLDIEKNVKFIGYVVGDELVPLFKNAEFFVLPSLYEGFGTTVLEALASGTPVIASEIDAIKEIVDDAAYLVNPIDVNQISQAMNDFAKNQSLKEEFSQKGKELAQKFDWEKCARETLDLYKKIAKKNG